MNYIKEQKKYNVDELESKFKFNNDILKNLKDRKIIYTNENNAFSFRFVGILIVNDNVIICIPKYIHESDCIQIAKQILVLLREYSKRETLDFEELETLSGFEPFASYNLLSTIIFLLTDYFENGLYSNENNIYVLNGEGEIDWLKTINDSNLPPLISENGPIYIECYTNSTQDDKENYFKQLHKYVLDLCSKKLDRFGLLEFLDIRPINFNINEDILGTPETIIYKINNEINTQFVSRKQRLLKAISVFISNEKIYTDKPSISLYGTNTFYKVWEKTCGYVLNNNYESVKRYIARPKWRTESGKEYDADTLIPDIIVINKGIFNILDAKYYNIILADDEKLCNNPGVEDITKQYLYELAFDNYIKDNNFRVRNILIFPTEEEKIIKIGDVTIDFLKKLNLKDIILFKISANKIFDLYIRRQRVDLESLFSSDSY